MLAFDHIGITTREPKPDENWIEQSRCWVTNPRNHPESIEFLRYEPDSQVPERVKNNPHIAFRVDRLEPHIEGQEIIIPPFVVAGFVEAVFIWKYDTVFEYMRYLKDSWFDK
ncbi:MAG: hypothetical protein JO273_00415 [Methylobacteriaceae bacterium]|nr:hypothetical protein [Methylobacteriaceae bacterium]